MKHSLSILVAALPLAAWAASSSPDAAFYKQAAEGGMAEVEAGKMAESKASMDSVRKFGAMMVKDHGEANDKLKGIAAGKSVKLPDSPDLKHKAMAKMMEKKAGADFDEAYIDSQVKDHQDTVALLQKEIDSGKDDDAKAFAREVLPKVRQHLKAIQDIKAGAGAHAGTH